MNGCSPRPLLLGLALSLTPLAQAADPLSDPYPFDCTAAETLQYIEQTTWAESAPSPITPPDEHKDAFMQREAELAASGDADAQSCVTIFTDPKLKDDWKDLVDDVRNMEINISFKSIDGAVLQALIDKGKELITEKVNEALTQLGEDFCAMMSTDNFKQIILDEANQRYGLGMHALTMEEFSEGLTDQALARADKNILMLLSDNELESQMDRAASEKLREARRDLWQKF